MIMQIQQHCKYQIFIYLFYTWYLLGIQYILGEIKFNKKSSELAFDQIIWLMFLECEVTL